MWGNRRRMWAVTPERPMATANVKKVMTSPIPRA